MITVRAAAFAITILSAAQPVAPDAIPLREGLTIVTAIEEARGDYESIKTVVAVTTEEVHVAYSAEMRAGRRLSSMRRVLAKDMREAREYRQEFASNENRAYPGTTALGPSAAVLNDLNIAGEALFTCMTRTGGGRHTVKGIIRKIGLVKMPVLLNDARVELEAVHARGEFERETGDFFFLNDPRNPLTLRYRFEEKKDPRIARIEKMLGQTLPPRVYALDVVKISFAGAARHIEEGLRTEGRAEVYGIFFDFDSATIRSESAPVLEEIARVLHRNAVWRLDVEGTRTASAATCTTSICRSAGRRR